VPFLTGSCEPLSVPVPLAPTRELAAAAEQCDASAYLQGLGALMPGPPPGAPGPLALPGEEALRDLFAQAGLEVRSIDDIRGPTRSAS
jgi:hypothetical protein